MFAFFKPYVKGYISKKMFQKSKTYASFQHAIAIIYTLIYFFFELMKLLIQKTSQFLYVLI